MRKLIIAGAMMLSLNVFSQNLNEKTFDFWIGNWELTWTDAKGKEVKGQNRILRILGNKVIQENFKDSVNNYTGMSISMYNSITKVWHQTWMDSGGSHYNFTGDIIDGNPSFKTQMVEKGGKKLQQRMVFKDIKKGSFTWIWEGTRNGGKSWATLWKIKYKSKK